MQVTHTLFQNTSGSAFMVEIYFQFLKIKFEYICRHNLETICLLKECYILAIVVFHINVSLRRDHLYLRVLYSCKLLCSYESYPD